MLAIQTHSNWDGHIHHQFPSPLPVFLTTYWSQKISSLTSVFDLVQVQILIDSVPKCRDLSSRELSVTSQNQPNTVVLFYSLMVLSGITFTNNSKWVFSILSLDVFYNIYIYIHIHSPGECVISPSVSF